MNLKVLLFLFFVPLFSMSSAFAWVDQKTAVVRIMDKAAGKVQTVRLPVEQTAMFEKLSLMVRACKQSDAQEGDFVFIEISESDQGQIFSGWMSEKEPGGNPLQNPDYDLWLIKCE